MSDKPFLDEPRLRKALEAQGFTIANTSNGARVLAPDGVSSSGWHPSVFKGSGANRNYRNQMAQLVRIGFDLGAIDAPNGDRDDWRRDRAAIEAQLTEQESDAAEAKARELKAQREQAHRHELIGKLPRSELAVYEAVVSRPGLQPKEYAGAVDNVKGSLYSCGQRLREKGLIYTTGDRRSARWYPADVEPPTTAAVVRPPVTGYRDIVTHLQKATDGIEQLITRFETLEDEAKRTAKLIERIRKLLPDD